MDTTETTSAVAGPLLTREELAELQRLSDDTAEDSPLGATTGGSAASHAAAEAIRKLLYYWDSYDATCRDYLLSDVEEVWREMRAYFESEPVRRLLRLRGRCLTAADTKHVPQAQHDASVAALRAMCVRLRAERDEAIAALQLAEPLLRAHAAHGAIDAEGINRELEAANEARIILAKAERKG